LADIIVLMMSAPPAPSRSIDDSNIVTRAAPRSPERERDVFERRLWSFIGVREFMVVVSSFST
jgi:hypothetical protein